MQQHNACLRLWYKFETRKVSRFVRFTFRVKYVYPNSTDENTF